MNPIHDIKDRLDIVAVAGEQLQLQRSGKNWKANCPFHPDKTPSFVVFPDSQRFTCFGTGCNQSGDLFDLVGRLNGWDFPTTLRYLADKAGVALAPLTEAERAHAEARQSLEWVFGTAMSYFQGHLFRPAPYFKGAQEGELKPDLGYALSRGWTKETLAEAGVGSFGSDRESLRRFLKSAGVDLDLPGVAALLGRRGGIAGWAEQHDLQLPQAWLDQDRIPSLPNQMLIFPHLERGRVVYLAGRSIDGKAHWNPPHDLVGPRQPYFNMYWETVPRTGDPTSPRPQAGLALIVEGQGDALTLAQWGLPALALAGCSLPSSSGLVSKVLEKARSSRILLALDSDEAGLEGAVKAAAQLNQAGLPADQIGVLRWPEKDANAWLQAGADGSQALALAESAPTYLDELLRLAREAPQDEDGLLQVFDVLAELPQHRILFHKQVVCTRLNIRKSHFDALLKEARLQKAATGYRKDPQGEEVQNYLKTEEGMFWRRFNAQGCPVLERLSNFSARIAEEIICDDGLQSQLEFLICGERAGLSLPTMRVRAEEFARMDWVVPGWGSEAVIEAGPRRRDQLRAAIQFLSSGIQKRRVFTHTGWRELAEGQRVYLSCSGALAGGGALDPACVDVDLDGDLARYSLPLQPVDPPGAMRLSLELLELAPLEISVPVWASIWLAPLSEILRPSFVLWLYGRTGTMKSTLAALALNHYGPDFDGGHFPANFTDTPYRLEQKAFHAKDALLVIDDYAPQKTQRDADQYRRTANHIIRAAGNQAGRGRLTRDARARLSYTPRGMILVTGEDLPDSESLVARLFIVEFKEGCVDMPRLGRLQAQRARLPHAMAGYLGWLLENWSAYCESVPERWRYYREQATGGGAHLRLPETAASLMMGFEMGLRYASSIGALTGSQYGHLIQQGWIVLLELSEQMMRRAKDERPEEIFLSTFRELLAQGKVYLRERGGLRAIGGDEERAEMLGWCDERFVYLLPEASYTRVARHFRDQGGVFPVRQLTLRKGLREAGWLVDLEGQSTPSLWMDGRSHRVLVLKREVLGEER